MKVKQAIKGVWDNKFVRIVIIVMITITIIAIILSVILRPGDNYNLSSEEKKLQSDIQSSMERDDARIAEVMVQDGDWSLAKINSTEDRGNYTMVIMQGEQLVLGPSSNFSIDTLANNGIPNSIIDYLYPDKPHWIGFYDAFQNQLKDSKSTIKAVIEAYAYVNNIQLDKVTMASTVTKQTVNPNSESMAGIVEFKFTINDQPEQYTYRSSYLVDTAKYTNQVIDKNNNVVYTSTISD